MKENGFTLKKVRTKRYPAETITDADHADDIALFVNTPIQAESLLHSLEQAAGGIGFHVNAKRKTTKKQKRSTCILIKKESSAL